VSDDGCGFDYQALISITARPRRFGLLNVRERIDFIGGEMHVDSAAGEGTTVTLGVQLAQIAGAEGQ
jgi:signal transduction histidine kinase